MPFLKTLARMVPLLVCLMAAGILPAAYINRMPVEVTQPDGTKLELFASGDEYHNWLHDADNFTVIADHLTGFYCYAVPSGEDVAAGPLIVGRDNPQRANLTPGINISQARYRQRRASRFQMPAQRNAPTIGSINNLVVFIRFSDETEFGQLSSVYTGWFNTSTNSLQNYFLEASYNQLSVSSTLYPLATTSYLVSWQDSLPRAYYQPYSATNPAGYIDDDDSRNREFTLLQNAVNGVSAQIPAELTIDSDNDGRVDNVVFIVRGSAGAWSSLLWPHRWSLYDRYVYIHGKRVYDFNLQIQNSLTTRAVGILCHEFFHTLGAPDLYHYTSDGISPAGTWDIMQTDEDPPQHMTAFMKYKYGHWIDSIPTIIADQAYTLNPLTSPTGNAYRIDSQDPTQYYVVEFRKKTGTFESSIPGSGMLIYRIDTTAGNGNADGPPDELYIYRLNGTTTTNGTLSAANFSTETGRTRIDANTNPSPFLSDGSPGNLYLCEIGSSAGTTMTFRKGAPSLDFSVNPYVQGFDASYFPPDGWTNQAQSGSYLFTRVNSGTNPTCAPQSGAAMLRYNSDLAPVGNSALLATPKIANADPGYGHKLTFWMYRDGNQSSALDKIEAYLDTTTDLSGSPILLGTIFRHRLQAPVATVPGWYQYSFTLPITTPGDYYGVLRAVSASGYNMYLDSFRVARVPLAATNPSPTHLTQRVALSSPLVWESGGGVPTGYKLCFGTDDPPTNITNNLDLGEVLSYTPAEALLPGTTYFWKIVPYGAGGDASDCSVWSFMTLPAVDLQAVALQSPVYAMAGGNVSFELTVHNGGVLDVGQYVIRVVSTADSATLVSMEINTPLAVGATAEHILSWIPVAPSQYSVSGVVNATGDQDASNDATAPNLVYIYPENSQTQIVGDTETALSSAFLPLSFWYKNSLSETIYLASDLQLASGNVSGLVYRNDFSSEWNNKPVRIWLKNTVSADLNTGWLGFDDYTLVFDGVLDFPVGVNEIFVPLVAPFAYNGTNLAVRCSRPWDPTYFTGVFKFFYNAAAETPNRSRQIYSDVTVIDPAVPFGNGTLTSNIPLTTFIISDPVPLTLPTPVVSITLTESGFVLSWDNQPGYNSFDIYASSDPTVWPENPVATVQTNSYIFGVSARQFFRVVARSD